MFDKKKKPFNPYEKRADDALYEVWETRAWNTMIMLKKTRKSLTTIKKNGLP